MSRWKLVPSGNSNIAGWNIPIFNRKYIVISSPCSIAMLDYRSVNGSDQWVISPILINGGVTCGEPTHFLTIDPNFQRDIQAGVTLRVFVTMDLAGLESYQSFSDTLGARLADI